MNCPVCTNVQLAIAHRSGIEIDYCPQCRGMWLDRGELDKIVERLQAEAGMAPSPREPVQSRDERYEERGRYEGREKDRYRRDDDDDDDRRRKKKGGFLGDIFEIFD